MFAVQEVLGRQWDDMDKYAPPGQPIGVFAMSAFFGFGALASGLAAISLLTPVGPLDSIWRLNPRAYTRLLGLGGWAPFPMAAICLACAAAAYGFAYGRRWGYRLGIGLLSLNCVGDLANVVLGIEPRAIVGIPIAALLLWYLLSRRVRSYFSRAAAHAA